MRLSANPIQTLKEVPAEAEIVSHRLMLRAGLIRRVAGGLYTWLPMGLRVLRRVERVIREEMDRAGALEISMPVTQPGELWVEATLPRRAAPPACAPSPSRRSAALAVTTS